MNDMTHPAGGDHALASRAAWQEARVALMAREKALTRQRDEIAAARRALPWVRLEKAYGFEGPDGPVTLAGLFGGRRQLLVYHFMFGPDWEEGCPSCSLLCDHFDGALPHLAARDVSLAAVSRGPMPAIAAFKRRMGWGFPWVSSGDGDFNRDFGVAFDEAERTAGAAVYNFATMPFPTTDAPGLSAFVRGPGDEILHTYSTYARGLDTLIGAYNLLDMAPMGRNEAELPWTMAWVRHHDRYETAGGGCCAAG